MDTVVIETYFLTVFNELKRDGLGQRYKRQGITEYFSSLIRGSEEPKKACQVIVHSAGELHAKEKIKNGNICPLGKYHNILYVAVKLAYDWSIADGLTIRNLLREIYYCEKTFERIVIAAILGPRVTRLLSGWQADFRDERQSLDALKYFLNHATKQKLTFHLNSMANVSMPSYHNALPAYLACIMDRPDALLLLLQYGARIGRCEHGAWEADPLTYVQQIIRISDSVMSNSHVSKQSLDCITILLRVIPNPTLSDERLSNFKGIINNLGLSKNEGTLKHLARCAVRRQLALVWQLPHGINTLPIPKTLIPYINLTED